MSNLQNFNTRELASKHAFLMQEIEQLPPGTEASPVMKQKLKELEEELQKRLHKALSSDVLPIVSKEVT